MANTTNLNLYLPQSTDYVNVKRDISDNLQAIDDAFTIEDITSTLTFADYITLQSGGVYKIGKLIIVQLRVFSSTEAISGGKQIITSGMPKARGGLAGTSPVGFHCNRLGISLYLQQDNGGISVLSLSTETVATGNAIYVDGVYLAE